MSATDSSNLIDSPAGNKLGVNRAWPTAKSRARWKVPALRRANAKWLAEVKEKLVAVRRQRHQPGDAPPDPAEALARRKPKSQTAG